ncbi:two-component system, response regulator YesN [Paenibacillus sp. UNCCL117]|uniref:response regulator n=1 Tax=unclassified Paenibacillus TaxID=185978 RepID=UPI00088CEBD0|nr:MULTISPECIES: response regulator [unclassified Paenibacillus]SDE56255.1 two-component system, response regulator YesN [Paenibacillus sp. cl123]SFW66226.1 two-component system, response regulator YesN [Paenibacillus sp. UNCCL117]
MKVLIVDDEKHVRNTIRMLADWPALKVDVILEAENGADAIELIQTERPQVVITDIMMPLKNGLDLMGWMNAHAGDCKKMVISGYNDFEYARQTIKHGGIDYLLKPIVPHQLQEALKKAVDAWNEEERRRRHELTRNQEVSKLQDVYRDKLLSGLILEAGGHSGEIDGLLERYPELRRTQSCRVAVLSFEFMERSVREKYGSDRDRLVSELIEICSRALHPAGHGTAFRNLNGKHEIGMLLWGDLERTEGTISRIHQDIVRRLHARFDIGIGLELPFPGGLQDSCLQARRALRQRNLLDPDNRLHMYRQETGLKLGTLRFGEHEEPIGLALRSGRSEQLDQALHEWFDALAQLETITLQQLELWQDEFTVRLIRWTEEFLPDASSVPEQLPPDVLEWQSFPMDDLGRFSLALFQGQVSRSLAALQRMFQTRKAQSGHTMHDIARYIQLNYQKNITLQDISAQFHLNREYISRKFKLELKENVIDYLNRVRIEKAKVLLLNPHVKVSEAARLVGYQDEKYFSRVFKKLEGQSPKEFRVLEE